MALGRMVTSKSLIDAGRLQVLGDRYLRVEEAYWLVYPPRSQEHRGLQVFRDWLRAEAEDYCQQMPVLSRDDTRSRLMRFRQAAARVMMVDRCNPSSGVEP